MLGTREKPPSIVTGAVRDAKPGAPPQTVLHTAGRPAQTPQGRVRRSSACRSQRCPINSLTCPTTLRHSDSFPCWSNRVRAQAPQTPPTCVARATFALADRPVPTLSPELHNSRSRSEWAAPLFPCLRSNQVPLACFHSYRHCRSPLGSWRWWGGCCGLSDCAAALEAAPL